LYEAYPIPKRLMEQQMLLKKERKCLKFWDKTRVKEDKKIFKEYF